MKPKYEIGQKVKCNFNTVIDGEYATIEVNGIVEDIRQVDLSQWRGTRTTGWNFEEICLTNLKQAKSKLSSLETAAHHREKQTA